MKEKILIALNDQILVNLLIQTLKKFGYEIEIVKNGGDVIESLKTNKPDLILLDTILPGRDGYDILKEKNSDNNISKIPIIIISNSGVPIRMSQIPSTPSIKDYIIRFHIEPSEIIEKIEKAFGRGFISDSPVSRFTGNGKKILWVEDDKLLSTILSKKIQQSNFILLKAISGEEVFKFLETEIPDVIILDILLPEMNGFDILQKIKMIGKFKNIPVIMLSNLSKQSDIDKAKLLGANKFIVKAAVSLDEIMKEIDILINAK